VTDLEQLKGKVVVLECWATWCPPCRDSIPHLSEMYTKYKNSGVVMIGITNENKYELITGFVKKMGDKMNYTVAIDANGVMEAYTRPFGVRGIPHAFIIDREGKIVYSGHPMQPDFRSKLDSLSKTGNTSTSTSTSNTNTSDPDAEDKKTYRMSKAEVEKLSVSQLKAFLRRRQVDTSGIEEKSGLIAKVLEAIAAKYGATTNGSSADGGSSSSGSSSGDSTSGSNGGDSNPKDDTKSTTEQSSSADTASPSPSSTTPDLESLGREEILKLSAGVIKAFLKTKHVDTSDCLSKEELTDRLMEQRK